jgi:hypothetical protein
MTVEDEVAVGGLLILADASFDEGRVFQSREAKGTYSRTSFRRVLTDYALAVGGIEGGATRVVGNFKSAAGVA